MIYSKLENIKQLSFGYEEIARALGISRPSARVSANRYVGQGLLLRLKRNTYILKNRWRSLTEIQRLSLANIIQTPSYVSLMTALSYYDITTQIQRDFVESVAVKRTKKFAVDGVIFNYAKIDKRLYFGFARDKDLFIASPEKALMDAVYLTSLKRYDFDPGSISTGRFNAAALRSIAVKFPKKSRELLTEYGYVKKA